MKLEKMKKVTIIEIITILLALIALIIYYSPNLIHKKEVLQASKIRANNAIFVSKALELFSSDKKLKSSEIANIVMNELNKTTQNPYYKNQSAYTQKKDCVGCNNVTFDDKQQIIVLTTYDNKSKLIVRTVIKPPSYVEFYKFEDEK